MFKEQDKSSKFKVEKRHGNLGLTDRNNWNIRENWSHQLEHKQVPKGVKEPGIRNGKRSLLGCHTRCKCSIKTTRNFVNVKLGIRVMEFVERLISWEVTVTGQWSECNLAIFGTMVKVKVTKSLVLFERALSNEYTRVIQKVLLLTAFHTQREKRRRSDPVLWQNPLYQQKIRKPKDNTHKRHQKLQLHNDCGPT